MTEPTHNFDEPTPLPDIEETITPLAGTLDDLAATVESASDDAASTVDDMQAAAEEAASATVAAAGEPLSATIGAVEETTSAAATAAEEAFAPVADTSSEMPVLSEEYVEPVAEELRTTVDDMAAPFAPEAPVQPEVPPVTAVPPLPAPVAAPAAATTPSDVASDDRLIAALSWLGLVLLQLPLVNIVILLADGNKNRPFQRHHAVQGIGFWVGAIIYEILAVVVFTVGSIVTLGLGALCLWVIFFLPHLLALVYAWQAYQGKELNIPLVTKFMKQQGWLA
jgi:uncharacterized membrane protein